VSSRTARATQRNPVSTNKQTLEVYEINKRRKYLNILKNSPCFILVLLQKKKKPAFLTPEVVQSFVEQPQDLTLKCNPLKRNSIRETKGNVV
jgi:hypothetical protein